MGFFDAKMKVTYSNCNHRSTAKRKEAREKRGGTSSEEAEKGKGICVYVRVSLFVCGLSGKKKKKGRYCFVMYFLWDVCLVL